MTFDTTDRAAAGRIGRFTTPHGAVTTPTLMPVVNPNISLLSPREMRERFGCEMVITNSYVIHKHEKLRALALERGVHDLIDWDGPVMTDSGTFQMHVYGDVEVGPEDIVRFQRDMGVDVATCLDIFATPDMSRAEVEDAVRVTLERTASAVEHKGVSLLNATVQGGTHPELRKYCAEQYRDLGIDYHTIGGVVPMMERQMYPELVEAILWSQAGLRRDRPVHLFGAGHPLVFPLAVALGCDLFDSSSYAKYAKDGRIMTTEGTLHLADLAVADEWPLLSRSLDDWSPKELQGAPQPERLKALASHNLEVCFSDLRRIRHAIREGTLWELVEQRAACHPLLAAATRKLGDPIYQEWLEEREPLSHRKAMRYTGSLTHRRPQFLRIRRRLQERFVPLGDEVEAHGSAWADEGALVRELGMHKEPSDKPYGTRLGSLDPDMDHVVLSALGPVPVGLDEAYPFAQSVLPRLDGLDKGHMGWVGETKDALLEAHRMVPAIPGPGGTHGRVDLGHLQVVRTCDWQFGAGAGHALTRGELRLERSRKTRKLRTVHLDGKHILSLRAHDAFWTLKPDGGRILHAALAAPACRVVVHQDSVPFNRDGKSVFAQFVLAMDPGLRAGDECLVVDEDDALLAIGQVLLPPADVHDFGRGQAVKVREGFTA